MYIGLIFLDWYDIWGIHNRYPGGPLLNPLGLAKDIKNAHEWKLKEIKNGDAFFLNISDYVGYISYGPYGFELIELMF